MTEPDPEPYGKSETESHDSILVEFTDAQLIVMPPDPRLLAEAVRHARPWLPGDRPEPDPHASVDLAECLLEQAELLNALRRFPDAAARAEEAATLFEQVGDFKRVADSFRAAATAHGGLGDAERALDFLGKEGDIRRRLAA